jgi:oligopeptide transport system substrate-binding protein
LAACSGGESDGSDYIFRYDLPVNPRTLDPQTATDEHSRLVIANIFEGLLKMDSQGNTVPGVAERYEVTEDARRYTFYLREDVFWTDKNGFLAQCTAHDFVFAFQRLFDPAVKSRNAADYFAILNAERVNEGDFTVEALGVHASGDFIFEIMLEYPDSNLPVLLTAPPAFPCNEEFYILAAGRYGLITAESPVASNGAFFLHEWVYDPWWTDENRILLRRHAENHRHNRIEPRGVSFFMDREDGALAGFTGGRSDCIIIRCTESAEELIRRGFPHTAAENSVWGFMFNPDGMFGDEDLRLTLANALDRDTTAIIPRGITVGGFGFREFAGQPDSLTGQPDTAPAPTEFPVLIVPAASEDDAVLEQVRAMVQQWQEKLSVFCRIEPLSQHEFDTRLAEGDYDIAAVRVTAAYNSPSAILDTLVRDSPAARDFLRKARFAESPQDVARFYRAAEGELLQAAEFVPFCAVTEYFFTHKRSEGLVHNPFTGTIDFREAKFS